MKPLFTFCKARQKKQKENHATKVTNIPKRKYGMNETISTQK